MLSQKGPPTRSRACASYPKLALMASATVALSTRARTRTVEVSSTLLGFGRSNGQQVASRSHIHMSVQSEHPFFGKHSKLQRGTCSGAVQKLRKPVQSQNLLLARRFLPWTCFSLTLQQVVRLRLALPRE